MNWMVVKAEHGIAICMIEAIDSHEAVEGFEWKVIRDGMTLREASLFCAGWNLGIDQP